MRILAIETSCDETATAVVEDGTKIVRSVIASSTAMHKKYGGIVPEVAAREQIKSILPVIQEALEVGNGKWEAGKRDEKWDEIDAIAVTVGPGLIGSLLVGVETAKTLAFVTKKPLIPVNHVLAHMYANFVKSHSRVGGNPANQDEIPDQVGDDKKNIEFPAISLVVSGGHTELFLMKSLKELQWLGGTIDDAAGEAFDKTARLLGFENKGGVAIQEAAQKHNSPGGVTLPRPLMYDKTLNFSFSGLKTAILREWRKYEEHSEELINAFAYEVQEAITDVLVAKTINASKQYEAKSILISGGVAANLRLREKFSSKLQFLNSKLFVPPIELCTDNAVSIASYAFFRGQPTDWHTLTAIPDLSVEV